MSDDRKEDPVTAVDADTTDAETKTAAGSVSDVEPSKSPLPLIAGALGVVAVVFAVLVGWLGYGTIQDAAAESARTDAVAAAQEQAVAMLAYDFENVDEQTAAAADGLTGDFRDEYMNLMQNIIAPGAKEKSISVQVNVQASSVVSADADHAVTLLFLNQITTSSENPEAVSSGSRVRVELENQDGRWLVNRLTPI
ncbi:twin-arginine translocation pathway signal [Rhodococcus sp. NPDC060086]|uniref:twin-arginine translocation pathway signal n=1 Tax=Rhodococcus sp. NPDC060086 TaxID=3347055 RepID=UPI003648D0D5